MGLSDLFKEKHNWNLDELKAINALMSAQAQIDGNMDQNEIDLMFNVVSRLPGEKPSDWKEFCQSSMSTRPEDHFKVLKNMHTHKRKVLIASLALLAEADDNVDEDEIKFLGATGLLLGISPEDFS
ncbi:MAG: TerB family tellurite resistance protein [Bacteroidota bacterium]|nr:TerB family tellurite resistance protein [Bacteroidota bacterium]